MTAEKIKKRSKRYSLKNKKAFEKKTIKSISKKILLYSRHGLFKINYNYKKGIDNEFSKIMKFKVKNYFESRGFKVKFPDYSIWVIIDWSDKKMNISELIKFLRRVERKYGWKNHMLNQIDENQPKLFKYVNFSLDTRDMTIWQITFLIGGESTSFKVETKKDIMKIYKWLENNQWFTTPTQ